MSRLKFLHEFRSFFNFFNIFGLSPFSRHRVTQYLLIAYSLLQIQISIGIFVWAKYARTEEETTLAAIVTYLLLLAVIVTHFIISVEALYTRHRQANVVNILAGIDFLIHQKLKTLVHRKKEAHSIWVKVIGILIIIASLDGCIFYLRFTTQGTDNKIWWPVHYSIAAARFRCLQIVFYVILIRNRLNVINEKIDEFIVSNCLWTGVQQQEIVFFIDNSFDKTMKYNRLLTLKRIYGKLHDVNKLLNETFGWSLLAIFTQIIMVTTCYGYWLFLSVDMNERELSIINICTIVRLMFVAIIITYYCSACSNVVSEFCINFYFCGNQ